MYAIWILIVSPFKETSTNSSKELNLIKAGISDVILEQETPICLWQFVLAIGQITTPR